MNSSVIEHAARFWDKTDKGKISIQTVALILAQPGKPILRKMDVASDGNEVCTIWHHLNLHPRALPPIRFIIWPSQPDLNALRPGSFHFWKILRAIFSSRSVLEMNYLLPSSPGGGGSGERWTRRNLRREDCVCLRSYLCERAVALHCSDECLHESRMREICMSGSTRGRGALMFSMLPPLLYRPSR